MTGSGRLSRRDFLKLLKVGLLDLAVLTALGGTYGAWIEPNWPAVTRLKIAIPGLRPGLAGLRIAQVSDIHMGGWMNRARLRRVLALAMAERPDLLVLTGDFVSGHAWGVDMEAALAELQGLLAGLTARLPVYAVLGNHDHWVSADAVRGMLAACGVTDLRNRAQLLERDGARLYLCGVDSAWVGENRVTDALAGMAEGIPAVLLAHEPDPADEYAATGRFALQLSGHSHGGQVALPTWGPILSPWLAKKYVTGMYQLGGMKLYVNRGAGMVPPNIRLLCRPEVTVFTLAPERDGGN